MSSADRRQRIFLLLATFVMLASGLGLRSPWPPDEPRFALIARDMAAGGDWLFPMVGGVLYPDKPPLFLWLVACAQRLVGSVDVAFLLPALVSGVLVTALVADLGARLRDGPAGILCGAFLVTSVQFPLQMRGGQIDALLCLWTTLALYGFCRHLLLGPDWRWYGLAGAACGLGILTKGVGFLPYFVLLPYGLAKVLGWPLPPPHGSPVRWLLAPAATAAVVCAWLLPMLAVVASSHDAALIQYRDDILFHQTVTRYVNSWGHIKPPWYLLTNAVPLLWLPLTLLLPQLLPAWRRGVARRDAAVLVLGGWVLLVLLFFSLSAGKRSVYIFPALPAIALLAGLYGGEVLKRPAARRVLCGFAIALAVSLVALAAWFLADPSRAACWIGDPAAVAGAARGSGITGLVMLSAIPVCRKHALRGAVVATLLFWAGMGMLVAPAIDGDRSGTRLMRAAEERAGVDRHLALVDWPEQFLLQARRPVHHFGYRRNPAAEVHEAAAWLGAAEDRMLLLPEQLAAECFVPERVEPLGRAHRRTWVLASAEAASDACTPENGTVFLYRPPLAPKDLRGSRL